MRQIYTQLRVSCGLSSIVNATQPQDLKISPSETFAHWLDAQWLRMTNNNDASNPLVNLCYSKEHQWVAVLDYILLRKIRSSFLLCKGISPAALTTEVEYEELNWTTLSKVFITILDRLNKMEKDWPIWNYEGELKDLETQMKDERFRKEALKKIQSIKIFYEIFQSNIRIGLEADWKQAVSSLDGNFPEKVSPSAVVNHLDYYKTDFELNGLLETLGYVADHTYGMQYPSNVKPNSIVLINRPGHWVCEDNSSMGSRQTVLDSLTASTDSVRMGDTFNYFKPLNDQKFFKKILPKLTKLFPDVEISIEDEGLTEFPELILPKTDHPAVEAIDYHQSAQKAYRVGDFKNALLDKRIECALLETADDPPLYFKNLVEFTEWCLSHDKDKTAEENITKLRELENKLSAEYMPEIISFHKMIAGSYAKHEEYEKASGEYELALEIYDNDSFEDPHNEMFYELTNGLGINYARLRKWKKSKSSFHKALDYAYKALEESNDVIAEDELGAAHKYWPAIITGLKNKINDVESQIHENQISHVE